MEPQSPCVTRDRELLRWMFSFLRPVTGRAILSCLYLSLWIGAEILAVRQTAEVINQVKTVQFSEHVATSGFWVWITSSNPNVARLRHIVLVLGGIAAGMALLTFLREVSNAKFSMY